MFGRLLATSNNCSLTILRLVLGIVFLPHGMQKVFGAFGGAGFAGTMNFFTNTAHIPALFAFLAIMAEFLGGLGLILGLLTRVAAFGILCNMVVAVMTVHRHFGFFMNWTGKQKGEGFEFHLLAIAMAVVLVIWGGGSLSIDRLLSGSRSPGTGQRAAV